MSSGSSFWAMGGYAGYVWSAYGSLLVVLVVNIAVPLIRHRRLRRRIRAGEFDDD
ncbi:heme exporter protein CcmD [Salinisphaera sp. SPP-AMP-43]|uniref:heme exporter protein CcmD n=1 Tax=Salinisphaera sp. SPP-AMP-43 TaxID=3121288 RepID=UPI003C6E172D